MRKCDFCKNELTCSGVNRSECIVRDFYNFEAERTPADDVTTITRLIMGCQTLDPVAIARSNAVKKRKAINIQWDIDEDDCECGAVLLPLEIEIPNNMTDLEDITDYISDVTGFCHKGFELEE